MRAEHGASPAIPGIDTGVIKMIITDVAAVRGLDIFPMPVNQARAALKRHDLICKGAERDLAPQHGRVESPLSMLL